MSSPYQGDCKPPKPGDQPETVRRYEEAKQKLRDGKGTSSDVYTVSEWDWDHERGGNQRR